MAILSFIFQLIGSLGLLLYGMKLMSDGIQKSAGASLHRIMNFMTKNRFMAVLTGLCITGIIQSSGATTVMTVSFVNAGLLTLPQSIGVIFGANIGTTVTAWIVSLFGFSFKLSAFAIPTFGVGFFLTFFRKLNKEGLGEALMGFGLLFVGLELLAKTIPTVTPDQMQFVAFFTDKGFLGLLVGVIVGMLVTMLIHSSSASTAIILTMAYNGLLTWEFSAAMVLGSNIGSTIDAVLAAIGTKVNARRAAAVHVLFNVTGTILAMVFFRPFLSLVEFIVPGDLTRDTITTHIATLHTIFNTINTLLFLPFVNQIARLVEIAIKPGAHEPPPTYRLDFATTGIVDNAESFVYRAEREIVSMSELVQKMLSSFSALLDGFPDGNVSEAVADIHNQEDYADQMQEELSSFLVKTSRLPLPERNQNNVRQMLSVVDDLESVTDDIFSASCLLERSIKKSMTFRGDDVDRLKPYLETVGRFMRFVHAKLNKHLTADELAQAHEMEAQIDAFRKDLKKVARRRLEEGADVKSELLYIDLVRVIEKMGDRAYGISEALAATR
jgi:phosphate:Na+ symporter